jgi:hypothetical protein
MSGSPKKRAAPGGSSASPDRKAKQARMARVAPPDTWRESRKLSNEWWNDHVLTRSCVSVDDYVTENKVRDNVRSGLFNVLGEKFFPGKFFPHLKVQIFHF